MWQGSPVKGYLVCSARFLMWSLLGGFFLYTLTTLVVLAAGLVSLVTGWFPASIESGPLGFLGYAMRIDNRTDFVMAFEVTLPGFLALVAAAGVLLGVVTAIRSMGTSRRS